MNNAEILNNFYSPNHLREPGQVLESRLGQLSEFITKTLHLDTIEPEDVLGQELYHLGLGVFDEYASNLEGVDVDALRENGDAVISERLSGLVRLLDNKTKNKIDPTTASLVEYGALICKLSHHGMYRKNGLPYYTHPYAVAKIIEIAWSRFQSAEEIIHFERILFGALVHDTFEDSLPNDNSTFLNHNGFLVTPKFVESLFDSLERIDGIDAAKTLHAVSKSSIGGEVAENDRYIDQVTRDPDAVIIKLSDTHHNRTLDPKEITNVEPETLKRNRERSQKYDENKNRLLSAINNEPVIFQLAAHAILTVNKDDLRHYTSLIDVLPQKTTSP